MDRQAAVALRGASFKYVPGGDDWVVKDFDLEVATTDRIAIYGPNGCGKSTLLYLLAGLLPLEAGSRTAPPGFRTGFVFQDYTRSLLNWYSVAENFDIVARTRGGAAAHEAELRHVFGGAVPDWVVGALRKYPYELSGGQRQLISFLRALLGRPRMIFLDEPFASLDVGHKHIAGELLQRARDQETGWLVIAHDLDDCLLASERIIVVQGPPLCVANTVSVPLEWPRSYQALGSAAVQAAREKVYEVLWQSAADM